MPARYPAGTVRSLLDTDLVTPATRRVLTERLRRRDRAYTPQFFTDAEMATLRTVAARLIPQHAPDPVDIAAFIDERLAAGTGKGWRYDTLPPDREAYRLALAALERESTERYQRGFAALTGEQQDAVLSMLQRGDLGADASRGIDAPRCFEELLAECTEIYFADPIAQETIGFVGMADAQGFHALGLNRLEPHEPRAID